VQIAINYNSQIGELVKN